MALEPGLYVAATPIGNLKDVTFRVIETLKEADLILCEDTRQTAKLCAAYGIKTPRAPYHEHNAEKARPAILARLENGERVCLVSDAGTPLISDPGYKLVREARDRGVRVTPLPGASALIAALSASGAPTDRFLFLGFPPAKAGARRAFFEAAARIEATLVFYESAARLAESLAAMAQALGDRRAAVARELTKLHEEIAEDRLPALAARYAETPPKGEIVVVVHPPEPAAPAEAGDVEAFLRRALGEMSVKDAAAAAADALGVARKEAYAAALKVKEEIS
ncbi:MAG: 16S rRNA (cytidine(1402)-2'-O)-methyltransferase [Alphaproteobacteria bacterium]|nr:16S rRNA (cytidine(1402)-2'-O)-methyltransferase [Alphaproteobacteria bacterium]